MVSVKTILISFRNRMWQVIIITWCFFGVAACAQQELGSINTITATAAKPLLLIGLSANASGLRTYFDEADIRSNYRFILGNDQTLIADVTEGRLDAAFVYWVPEGDQLWFNPIALDGLVIIHSPSNSIQDLDLEQVKAIYNGQLKNWSELGGSEGEIMLITREKGSGSRVILQRQIMNGLPIDSSAQVVSSDDRIIDLISSNENAIGYLMMGSTDGINAFIISGSEANPESTADQTYPLTTPLYFVSKKEPEGDLRVLLATIQSEQVQISLSEKYGRIR